MIAMWDECFAGMNQRVVDLLDQEDGHGAFELMHQQLDAVWRECSRTLRDGGYCCINIGDATRSIGGRFQLFSNHARIIESARRSGFDSMPDIIWRKPSNAPNKFMGSGMLPCGAHVTYEHEYILIFRKAPARLFETLEEKSNRRMSAVFWGERNAWYSDLWTGLTGTRQELGDSNMRARSAAYPLEVPYRLILMFSVLGDTVMDPFMGTGTTAASALSCGRNSVGIEWAPELTSLWGDALRCGVSSGQRRATDRINHQRDAIEARLAAAKPAKHHNEFYDLSVVTRQERELRIPSPLSVDVNALDARATFDFLPTERAIQGELF